MADTSVQHYPATLEVRFRAELVNAVLHAVTALSRVEQRPIGVRLGHVGDDYAAFTLTREQAAAVEVRNYLVRLPQRVTNAGEIGRFDDQGRQMELDERDRAFAAVFGQGLVLALRTLDAPAQPEAGPGERSRLH